MLKAVIGIFSFWLLVVRFLRSFCTRFSSREDAVGMQGFLIMRRTKAVVCVSSYFANTQNIVSALTVHLLLICIPFFVFFSPEGKATWA